MMALVIHRSGDCKAAPAPPSVWIALIPPLTVGVAVSVAFYSRLIIGGGPELPFSDVAISTLRLAFGLPETTAGLETLSNLQSLIAVGALLVVIVGARSWIHSRPHESVLIAAILCAPFFIVLITQPRFIMGRYFIIQLVFLYLVAARALVHISEKGSRGRTSASILIILFIVGSLRLDRDLIREKRSHFLNIIHTIQTRERSGHTTLGGDQDFQIKLRCSYTALHQPKHACPTYVPDYINASKQPDFLLRETLAGMPPLPGNLSLPSGTTYSLIHVYPAPPWSGATAYLYQRSESQ